MKLKRIVVPAIHLAAWLSGYSLRRAKSIEGARILMFHGVGDDEYSEQQFEEHLQFLKRNFEIISIDDLVKRLGTGQNVNGRVALTFDDGLRNNLTSAYRILKKLSLPATFFVCPGLVQRNRWLWNHEARARLRSMGPSERQTLLQKAGAPGPHDSTDAVVEWMKTLPLESRQEVEDLIRTHTSAFAPSDVQKVKYDLMTWDELASLDNNLIAIGSHTSNHPILSRLRRHEIAAELHESRALLEQKLHRKVDQFCYPNGAHNPIVIDEVQKIYRIALTTDPGFAKPGCDLLRLPRIGIAPQPLLSWRLHRPTA